jgi:hypothetical protein
VNDTEKKDPLSPATTSDAYDQMSPDWKMMETLCAGTKAMRDAGTDYLPQHSEESDEQYTNRRAAATLLNRTEQTLTTLAAKPFVKPIEISKDAPEWVEAFADDVDLQGNNLDVFCQRWFRESLMKAFCHVLVDFPKAQPKADGTPRTLEDDQKDRLRPYWVLIKPECLIYARSQVVNGQEVLTHVRISETTTEADGFADKLVTRIRVLEPGHTQLWIEVEEKGKKSWRVEAEWDTGLTAIPLVTFYADRQDLCLGKPPLRDLAFLNVAHWQSTSEQRHALTVARFPILCCSGSSADESDPIVVGPNKVLYNADPSSKFYYLEHAGTGIEAGRKDLEDLERQMDSFGAEFLKDKPGSPTATAKAIDSAEATSDLASMAMRFQDSVAYALYFVAQWLRQDYGGTVEVVKDWSDKANDPVALAQLAGARMSRDISRETYLGALQERGILPEDYDAEADQELIDAETQAIMGMTQQNLDPNAPPPAPTEKTTEDPEA